MISHRIFPLQSSIVEAFNNSLIVSAIYLSTYKCPNTYEDRRVYVESVKYERTTNDWMAWAIINEGHKIHY